MRKKKTSGSYSVSDAVLSSTPAICILAALSVIVGVFFITMQNSNKPIPRSEAISYTGEFEEYRISRNYREIYFKDGTTRYVYPHTETQEFQDKMKSLEEGTKLFLMINPNNDYVVEIKTETEELLNFEESQKKLDLYDNGYVFIGIFACAAGIFLFVYAIWSSVYKRKEAARHSKKVKKGDHCSIRNADFSVKSKILLEASVDTWEICYRRVKGINELVVNGKVYDEKKGIVELEHMLTASVDGHKIEAGLDKLSYSYITFDGERIAEKKRLI